MEGLCNNLAKHKHGAKQLFIVKLVSRQLVGCRVGFDIVGPLGLQYQICKIQLLAEGSSD